MVFTSQRVEGNYSVPSEGCATRGGKCIGKTRKDSGGRYRAGGCSPQICRDVTTSTFSTSLPSLSFAPFLFLTPSLSALLYQTPRNYHLFFSSTSFPALSSSLKLPLRPHPRTPPRSSVSSMADTRRLWVSATLAKSLGHEDQSFGTRRALVFILF